MPDNEVAGGKPRHPGAGRGKARPQPKGRQVDGQALAEIRTLLGPGPRRRDLLIEYLHLVQDRHRGLPAGLLAALAHELKLPLAEVYEVATFYHHFDMIEDGAPAPAAVTVRVCDSLSCALAGAERLMAALAADVGPGVRVVPAPCIGACDKAPAVHVGQRLIAHADAASIRAALVAGETTPQPISHRRLASYRRDGGYQLLEACRAGRRKPEEIIAVLEQAGLRGLGGAGFPTGQKWRLVRQQPAPRLLAINADEGEPGTFKDRYFLETDPHRMLEGMLIGAWAIEAKSIYVYLRDEYPGIRALLGEELKALAESGLSQGLEIELRRGAGAYICGEESAMLESIEGKRGLPRHKPPYPSEVGLFGRPTLINNVETLHWVRDIVERGAAWFVGQGENGRKGLHTFSVSGRVKQPGVKIAPAGITVRRLIDDFCGGMAAGHRFKGYLPGGASGGILPASMADLPLDFGTLEPHGCFIGSAAVVVLSDQDDVRMAAHNLMRFFAHESCGQCTPCRVGTEKAAALLGQPRWDRPLLSELSTAMQDASICGLGQAAPNPMLTALRYFPEDFA
ncbi:MAG: NAD(P)H-dependent oxidoreductase subunit E [Proteobacteria bacterium]|nr:NAD(P)H-dependent oxidoreductase subunit E [Pseudomonadota bacterium]